VPLALLRYGLNSKHKPWHIIPRTPELRSSYEVVIVGAGGHGLAAAYYLAKNHGITDVAVLERSYLGSGGTGRNTAIVRSNYLTPEGVRFYDRSIQLWRGLSNDLGINVMYTPRGHLTLAHTDATVRTSRWRAEVNKHLGVDSEVVGLDEIARLCPQLNLARDVRYPILAALYHPPGAIAHHDTVAWGYAMRAAELGAEIHQHTEVTGFDVSDDRIAAVHTNRGTVKAGRVLVAVAGNSSHVARMAGVLLPIKTVPLQACVSEPVKPVIDTIVVSGSLHVYISQTARGEFVMGGATDPYGLYSTRSTFDFPETLFAEMIELFPFLHNVRMMRQWAGMSDITPDFSPVMGLTPLANMYLDSGWGTWGFKATPICGWTMAECVATGSQPELIEPFRLDRFERFALVGERGAASVGH
jgi:sarcosine oxidase subunit beta